MNPPRYIGYNNVSDTVIDNSSTAYTGTEAVRFRIYMTDTNKFKYSLNAGYSYINENSHQTIANTTTNYFLGTNGVNTSSSDIGVAIKFTTLSGLSVGDYWEFDCCPQYVAKTDENGETIPPSEENFLGEFGKVFPKNELFDSGFEVMMRNPDSMTIESQKLSYYYTTRNDAYWKLTDNLHIDGSLQLLEKTIFLANIDSKITNPGSSQFEVKIKKRALCK